MLGKGRGNIGMNTPRVFLVSGGFVLLSSTAFAEDVALPGIEAGHRGILDRGLSEAGPGSVRPWRS